MLPNTESESDSAEPRGRQQPGLDRWLLRLVRSPLVVAALCIVLGVGVRLHGLDRAYTSDEGYWLQRTVRFGDALLNGNWVGTARSGHPGVTVMWVGLLGIGPSQIHAYSGKYAIGAATLEAVPGAERLLSAGRAAVAVVAAALFGLAVFLAGRLLRTAGLLGGALLALDPYTVGMTRLLHVDSLLTPLTIVSVLAGLVYWLRGRHWSLLVLSAVSGGLALLTKAPAITLVPFFGLVWLVVGQPWAGGWRAISRAWLAGLAWVTLAVAVYVALWPVLWIWPVYTIVAVAKFAVTIGGAPHLWPNYFLGQPTSGDPGLLFYPVATLLRLGPVATVGLVLLAVLAARRRLGSVAAGDTDIAGKPNAAPDRDGVSGGTVLWLLVFAIVFADVMAIGSKKFDRYMLPALAVLTILGGVGIWALARMLTGRVAAIVVLLALLGQGYWLLSAHSYPIAAYNPLVGGIGTARQAIMVGWGEGLDQAAAFLNRLPNARQLTVSTQYHHVLRPLFVGRTVRVPSTQPVDYYVVYVNMVQRNTVPIPVRAAMASSGPVFTATVDGEPFAWVYRGPFQIASTRDVPGEELDDGDDN